MGTNVTFILAEKATLADLCDLLELKNLGPIPPLNQDVRGCISGVDLPLGLALIEVREIDSEILDNACLQAISKKYPVIGGTFADGVNYCRCAKWLNGIEVWSVIHDACSNDRRHLSISGTPPKELEGICKRWFSELDESDEPEELDLVFEIPLELVETLTGYNYNHNENVDYLERRSS